MSALHQLPQHSVVYHQRLESPFGYRRNKMPIWAQRCRICSCLSGIGFIMILFMQFKPVSPKLTVYTFLSTECPISQQYTRTLEALHQRFGLSGIRFVAMFPLESDSPARIKQFRSAYGITFVGRPDSGARLARQFRVRATPEVVIMQEDGTVRYQGAIDDWYISLGKHRPQVTNAYLQNAIDALLTGRVVSPSRTEAVGCLLN